MGDNRKDIKKHNGEQYRKFYLFNTFFYPFLTAFMIEYVAAESTPEEHK